MSIIIFNEFTRRFSIGVSSFVDDSVLEELAQLKEDLSKFKYIDNVKFKFKDDSIIDIFSDYKAVGKSRIVVSLIQGDQDFSTIDSSKYKKLTVTAIGEKRKSMLYVYYKDFNLLSTYVSMEIQGNKGLVLGPYEVPISSDSEGSTFDYLVHLLNRLNSKLNLKLDSLSTIYPIALLYEELFSKVRGKLSIDLQEDHITLDYIKVNGNPLISITYGFDANIIINIDDTITDKYLSLNKYKLVFGNVFRSRKSGFNHVILNDKTGSCPLRDAFSGAYIDDEGYFNTY